MKTIVLAGIVCLISTSWLACKKSKDGPAQQRFEVVKLADKEWRSHKNETPWFILKFNSDSTGYQKNIHDLNALTYFTYDFKWSKCQNDSIKINYTTYWPITIRIYSVNDTMLVMNNWLYGGVKDTSKVKLFCN